ncbi:MAG: hypothetical protein WA154_12270 [Moraxellaceae bacterium]
MSAFKQFDQDTAEPVSIGSKSAMHTQAQIIPALLSRDELKPYYGIPAGSINLYISKYGLPQPVKVGIRTLWRKQDLDLWVNGLQSASLGTNGVHSD